MLRVVSQHEPEPPAGASTGDVDDVSPIEGLPS